MKKTHKLRIFTATLFFISVLFFFTRCSKQNDSDHINAVTSVNATSANIKCANVKGNRGITLGNGVNLQPSYFCDGNQNLGWKLMNQNPKITTVRIEFDPTNNATLSDFVRWISEAKANGKKIIATYHEDEFVGSANPADLITAAKWWKTNYATLAAAGSFTLNLINEWADHSVTAQQYADAYNQAIPIVRQVYSGPIICDIPGYGGGYHRGAQASPLINDQNIIFSAHIYPGSYDIESGWVTTDDIDLLAATGRPCIAGEFGSLLQGSSDWSALVDHAKVKGWPVLGWSWNGDGTTPKKMNMISPYWGASDGCNTSNYTKSSYFNTVYNKL